MQEPHYTWSGDGEGEGISGDRPRLKASSCSSRAVENRGMDNGAGDRLSGHVRNTELMEWSQSDGATAAHRG